MKLTVSGEDIAEFNRDSTLGTDRAEVKEWGLLQGTETSERLSSELHFFSRWN